MGVRRFRGETTEPTGRQVQCSAPRIRRTPFGCCSRLLKSSDEAFFSKKTQTLLLTSKTQASWHPAAKRLPHMFSPNSIPFFVEVSWGAGNSLRCEHYPKADKRLDWRHVQSMGWKKIIDYRSRDLLSVVRYSVIFWVLPDDSSIMLFDSCRRNRRIGATPGFSADGRCLVNSNPACTIST